MKLKRQQMFLHHNITATDYQPQYDLKSNLHKNRKKHSGSVPIHGSAVLYSWSY